MSGFRVALVALVTVLAVPGAAIAFSVPQPVVKTLDNGLTVAVFEDRRLPVTQAQLVVPAGSDQETVLEAGAANLVASALTLGTATRSRETFANDAAALGGRFVTAAHREYATIGGSWLSADLSEALALFAEAAREPALLEQEIETVRDRVLAALVQQRGSVSALADVHLPASALPGRGLGHPASGVIPTVERLTIAHLRDFHRRCYRPDRALLVIATDVAPATVFRLVEERFGSWAGKAPVPAGGAIAAPGKLRIRILDVRRRGLAELRLAVPGPGRGDVDATAISTLGRWLEGGGAARLRASGITNARTTTTMFREAGLVGLGGRAPVDSVVGAVRALRSVLRSLPDLAPDAASVRTLRASLSGGAQLALDSPAGWISQWIDYRLYSGTDRPFGAFAARWDDFGADDLKRATERWLRGSDGWLVVVGPAERLRPLLAPLGTVEVVASESPAVAVPALPSEITTEPTLKEIKDGRALLNAALQFHGGRSRLEKVRDATFDGELEATIDGETRSGTFRQLMLDPDRFLRTTVISNDASQQAIEGPTGWVRSAATGNSPVEVTGPALERMRRDARGDFRSLLLACADSSARVAARGRETMGSTQTDILEVVHPELGRHIVILDAGDHRVLAIDQPRLIETEQATLRHRYGEYRDVGGLVWPFYEDHSVRGELLLVLRFKTARFDTGLNPAMFGRPAEPRRLGGP